MHSVETALVLSLAGASFIGCAASGQAGAIGGGEGTSAGGTQTTSTSSTGGGSAGGGSNGGSSLAASASSGGRSSTAGSSSGGSAPSCNDGVQDGDETGVDCGGATCPSCTVSYALNPPDPCDNQFSVAGCQNGIASSACGGVCESKNICEGGKSGYANGYACSRYMLFSPEFGQAALDDAREYGWSDGGTSPFNYAVVGHDPDTSGLDQGLPNTCCACYQLVFVGAQYNDAGAPPPPLVVQTFDTGVGSTKDFDVFMGAGGFGAFDGCSAMGSSNGPPLYDSFPATGESSQGGVNVVNDYTSSCQVNGQVTTASIASSACQSAVQADCDSISSSMSSALTTTTQTSCIQSNQPATLYHENYDVVAKRVACPDHLTQVTGCKSPASGAGPVDPTATTASSATAAGFASGYTTTTMQDCCKPTCAWADNVGDAGVAPWNSFYTCDQSDKPLTQ